MRWLQFVTTSFCSAELKVANSVCHERTGSCHLMEKDGILSNCYLQFFWRNDEELGINGFLNGEIFGKTCIFAEKSD